MFGHRSHDPILTICQNNAQRRVEIRAINGPAEEILGYKNAAIAGTPLVDLLPARIQTLLNEYVEYEDDGNDVGTVLSRVQSFCLLDSHAKEVAFRLKVLRSESLDRHAYFRLILQGKGTERRSEAFRTVLRENFKGHEVLEPHTGLPDRASLAKDLELVQFYAKKDALRACVAVLGIDHTEEVERKHGEKTVYNALKHVATLARQNLRGDDTIGCISRSRLGIILIDTTPESARMVLNRLRWLAAASPMSLSGTDVLAMTVSIAFSGIHEQAGANTLDALEAALDSHSTQPGNALLDVA